MENLICVVDASTLIAGIQEIKQSVYSDYVRLYIPISTLEDVEQIYNISLIPKEVTKEQAPKKAVKASRKEQPLFDINPRIAHEYLLRSQTEQDCRVIFQKIEEQFSQWKQTVEQAMQAEQAAIGPPTSFAQALLRKLNMNDDSETNRVKGAAKPKLVARSTSPKSPWKHHRVPIISAEGLPDKLKPLLSGVLWRLHEYENSQLMPESLVLLTDDVRTRDVARKLNIPLKTTSELHQLLVEKRTKGDNRAKIGDVEKEFPQICEKVAEERIRSPEVDEIVHRVEAVKTMAVLEEDEMLAELTDMSCPKKITDDVVTEIAQEVLTDKSDSGETKAKTTEVQSTSDRVHIAPTISTINLESETLCPPSKSILNVVMKEVVRDEVSAVSKVIEIDAVKVFHAPGQSSEAPSSISNSHSFKVSSSSEDDSDDDEVIVFNPKARRFSGQPIKKTADVPQPKAVPSSGRARPSKENQNEVEHENKPRITSVLRAQSPVFTPQHSAPQPQIQSLNAAVEAQVPSPMPPIITVRSSPPRQPRTSNQNKDRNQELFQRQSRDIIQRQREAIQREAIQRVAQVVDKPPPRKVQMEPTANPTVIDPNAFDRSYVVQPRSRDVNLPHSNRGPHKHRRSNGGSVPNARASPKGVSRTPEPEMDFVLKSGSPRGAIRGRGKLWVP